jgi:hypothetical protein
MEAWKWQETGADEEEDLRSIPQGMNRLSGWSVKFSRLGSG